jgi:hypothetical protein
MYRLNNLRSNILKLLHYVIKGLKHIINNENKKAIEHFTIVSMTYRFYL